jgi:menaquinone reductase, multiheme cytochrome c subunit
MNTPEENATDVAPDAADEVAEPSSPEVEEIEVQVEEKEAEPGAVITLFFFVGFIASLILGWVIFPKLLYSKQSQPIDFNHVLHNEMVEEGCQSCHFFREDGTFAGVPKTEQCIECHEDVQGESPDEEKFVAEYVVKEREVPWLIYSKQPDCVFFSHTAHVIKAKMDCVTCHGHIGESESLKAYEANRITGLSRDIWGKNIAGFARHSWDRMKMYNCAVCHDKETRHEDSVEELPWPLNWMPIFIWKWDGGRQTSVQTKKDACFVCHK